MKGKRKRESKNEGCGGKERTMRKRETEREREREGGWVGRGMQAGWIQGGGFMNDRNRLRTLVPSLCARPPLLFALYFDLNASRAYIPASFSLSCFLLLL